MDSKKIIHAAVLGSTLVVSMQAMSATICSNGAASQVDSGTFVKAAFTPKCSANVLVDGADGADFGVKSASTKGKTIYGGSTAGGAISICTTFTSPPTSVSANTTGC